MREIYKFHRKDTDEWEDVYPEKWRWEAKYNDGTELKQFDDETGFFHQFKEIDQSKLHIFKMLSEDNPTGYQLLFNPVEMKLIHFYRNTVLNALTPEEIKLKTYIFGFEKIIDKKVYKHLMFIMPDDGLLITDDKEKVKIITESIN